MNNSIIVKVPSSFFNPARILWTVLIGFLVLIVPSAAKAELASYDEMQNVAQNWITYIVDQTGDWAGEVNPYVTDIQDIIVDDTLVARYYAVSSGGYVIVPALKELPPVKAYSEANYLDIYEEDGFALLLRQVLQHRYRIYGEVYGNLDIPQPASEQPLFDFKNRQNYDQLAVTPKDFASSSIKSLSSQFEGEGPLLTTAWHQGSPYNDLCPMGDGGRCVVGCVATAAAQIQYYHQWPPQGEGSHTYYWPGDNSCGGNTPGEYLSADFSDAYVYDNAPANLAEISYEMGVAFEMDYGNCGSGAWTMYGASVFPAYYRYDESAQAVYRESYTASGWFNLIKSNINKGRPLLYRIHSHAIVCDGWRVSGTLDQYHFNYGWGGGNNAWYTVDNLYCPWSGCDPMVEAMVINIIPKTGSPWLSSVNLLDDLGDGDGVPESGETIEMSVRVANYGGAPINDVSLSLTVDDANLSLVNATSYLGTINANDSVVNDADPFVFDIPVDYVSRIDSFMIEVSWNGGAGLDTLVVEKNIGEVSILLVDDDENADHDQYYKETLEHFRIPYDVWEFAAFSTPDAAYLSNYDIVIWFTGDYRSYPINNNEITSMQGYMDNGGKLFLTGQRIAAQLNSLDPNFLNNYLRADYLSSSYVPVLNSVGGQVFDSGFMVAIQGGNSASNQEYPDFLSPVNGGAGEMQYLGYEDFGVVTYDGSYQLVFFGFGFEAVVSDDNRWRDRDSVMSDILNFFSHQRPGLSPQVSDVAVFPGDPTHMLDHSPGIEWSYFDAEGSQQDQYQVQVGDDQSWLVPEMWDSGPLSGNDSVIVYSGDALLDGETYYIRVRAFDGSYWSDWAESEMHYNSVPAPATGLTPADLQGIASATPNLSHSNAIDGENDALTYTYEVYADSQLSMLIEQASGRPSSPGTSSYTVTTLLDDNSVYYWRVRGSDPLEDGYWSEPASFWVNSENTPPASFSLAYPEDGTTLPGLSVTFEWMPSSDTDPFDQVGYTLYYSTDSTFTTKTTVPDLDSTLYSPAASFDYGQTYFWKVRAHDDFGGLTFSSEIFLFSTLNRGDANGDGQINVADAVFLINHIFKGGPAPDPPIAGDANCDGNPNVGDAVYIINYVFNGGPEPGC